MIVLPPAKSGIHYSSTRVPSRSRVSKQASLSGLLVVTHLVSEISVIMLSISRTLSAQSATAVRSFHASAAVSAEVYRGAVKWFNATKCVPSPLSPACTPVSLCLLLVGNGQLMDASWENLITHLQWASLVRFGPYRSLLCAAPML